MSRKLKQCSFRKRDVVVNKSVLLNGEQVELVQSFKYLGIWIDNSLSLNNNFEKATCKIKHKLSLFRQLKYALPRDVKKSIYLTLIKLHLTYCNSLWYGAKLEVFHKVQPMVNQAMRII